MKDVEIIPTWDMTENEWLEARDRGLGGSDAGTVCGINKYKSPYSLWSEKSGLVERQSAGDAAKWGHRLELVVAEAYAEDYNKAVVSWPVILASKEPGFEFMFANLDFLIVEPSEQFPAGVVTDWKKTEWPDGVQSILEVKTSGIASPGTSHLWANNSIPESYLLQTTHYGIVTGIHSIVFAALLGGQGLVVREPEWDDNLAESLMVAEQMFWDMVLAGEPPAVDGSEATEAALAQRYARHSEGKVFEADNRFMEIWSEFQGAKAAAETAEQRKKELRAEIVSILGDSESATFNGSAVLTFRTSKDSETFDARRFQTENPELYATYLKPKPGVRTLREAK